MTKGGRWNRRWNDLLRRRARRHGLPWETWERYAARSFNVPAKEIARWLGRTLYALDNYRRRHGFYGGSS